MTEEQEYSRSDSDNDPRAALKAQVEAQSVLLLFAEYMGYALLMGQFLDMD